MATTTGIPWYAWALLTVICWGTYGVCMHTGSMNMVGSEKQNADHARIMAFLWVGLAYFLTAVIAPIIILKVKGGPIDFWAYPYKGWKWSLIAGILGAIGALGVLLAFGASPNPPIYVPVIMSIIFAGAPIVNAVINTTKEGNWSYVKVPFILGIVLAAVGGYLVTKNPPKPPETQKAENPAQAEKPAGGNEEGSG